MLCITEAAVVGDYICHTVTNVRPWVAETTAPENMRDTLTSSEYNSAHRSSFTIKLWRSLLPINYIYIIAFSLNSLRAFLCSETMSFRYSATIKLLSLIISFVPAVARKVMQGRHAGQYFQPKQLPIPASAKRHCKSRVVHGTKVTGSRKPIGTAQAGPPSRYISIGPCNLYSFLPLLSSLGFSC